MSFQGVNSKMTVYNRTYNLNFLKKKKEHTLFISLLERRFQADPILYNNDFLPFENYNINIIKLFLFKILFIIKKLYIN